jgi:hypothetical protein
MPRETGTCDPREVSATVVILHVQALVRGAGTAKEAREQIKAGFSPQPFVWAWRKDKKRFEILIRPYPGASDIRVTCSR